MSSRKLEDLVEIVTPSTIQVQADGTFPRCPICMEAIWEEKYTQDFRSEPEGMDHLPTRPKLCADHMFHMGCLKHWLKTNPSCPLCRTQLVVLTGYQPQTEGSTMDVVQDSVSLPGFEPAGTLCVRFFVAAGFQDLDCPLPGERFSAFQFTTFLPDNSEGQELVRLLSVAWTRRLLFRIGMNPATGRMDILTPNGIEMKTRRLGGIMAGGYPDASYMSRLKSDLREVGVV